MINFSDLFNKDFWLGSPDKKKEVESPYENSESLSLRLNAIIGQSKIVSGEERISERGTIYNRNVQWGAIDQQRALNKLGRWIINYALYHGLKPDSFIGTSSSAGKIGLATQLLWPGRAKCMRSEFPAITLRLPPNELYQDPVRKYFNGRPRGKVVLLSTATKSGDTLVDIIRRIHAITDENHEQAAKVIGAITLTDYRERMDRTVERRLEELGVYHHHSATYAEDLFEQYDLAAA
jgi:hypothetical protein